MILQKSDKLIIKIVETEEERLKAFLVRGIVYLEEQKCPYNEEFDLNDFTATQIIGLIDNEPILTARIRYFSNFAKLERVAIRKPYRKQGYAHKLIKYMIEFCLKKGYTKLYMHAQIRLKHFDEKYSFHQIGTPFYFSGYDYIEMVGNFKKNYNPEKYIKIAPLHLDRSEGNFDKANALELSAKNKPGNIIAI
ncbi:GNAT family N-acetyltransferase [Pectinatus frisingensis]|uniref:GNAT family N-acetyltransferase n=1 Tax=Pectinatus frisingensis TaxID=865 RepID=UPI0018C4B4BF|nr:GNAT family N-acetyltransferase [Pectinatus frisingensis]